MPNGTRRLARIAVTLTPFVTLVALLAAPAGGQSPDQLAPQGAAAVEVRHVLTFSENDLVFGRIQGYDTVQLPEGDSLRDYGRPALPTVTIRLALPDGMAATGVRMMGAAELRLPGEYAVLPAQPPQRISDANRPEFLEPDAATYSSVDAYPVTPAEVTYQADFAGQSFVALRVCPLRYVPAAGTLTLYTTIEIAVECVDGYECGDYLPARLSDAGYESCVRALAELVVNPERIAPRCADHPEPRSRSVEPGEYDYVIITQSSWVDDFQPLADWRTRSGTRATIVTLDWIYSSGGYSGSDVEKIRAFVEDARSSWGARLFLLGGDTNVVPYHTLHVLDDDIPNDTYYGDYDDDHYCEVHVGRASVRTSGAVATFVNKALDYELDPPRDGSLKTAGLLGFDLRENGSDEGEGCKQAIRSNYFPDGWTFSTEYDSEPGAHLTDTISILNQGCGLVNHIDHSSTYAMGAGYTNHDDMLSTSHMDNLVNGTHQSILYSIGCWANAYDHSACIAEHFVRNANGGGLAFVGNSRYGWYNPFSPDGVSLRYDRYFFRSLLERGHTTLGSCFSDHKNEAYQSDDHYRYIFTELTLLGDPGLLVWTDEPLDIQVSHPDSVTVNENTSFVVRVFAPGVGEMEDVTVCLWQEDGMYLVDDTNPFGRATFSFVPTTTGTLHVTTHSTNCMPYQGQVQITSAPDYTLVTDVVGSGEVVLDPPGGTYVSGSSVELTAVPESGWLFDNWEGDLDGSTNPDMILVDANLSVTAIFLVDCNDNSIPDEYDIAEGTSADCNSNAVPDECDIAAGSSEDANGNGIPDECESLSDPGDLDCDGDVDFDDIDPFVTALGGQGGYEAAYPDCNWLNADCDNDGDVDFDDIDPFVALLSGD